MKHEICNSEADNWSNVLSVLKGKPGKKGSQGRTGEQVPANSDDAYFSNRVLEYCRYTLPTPGL